MYTIGFRLRKIRTTLELIPTIHPTLEIVINAYSVDNTCEASNKSLHLFLVDGFMFTKYDKRIQI